MPGESRIKEQLSVLVELQALDVQIYALNKEKDRVPVELSKLQDALNAKKATLGSLEQKSKSLLSKRKERELELASKEDSAKKLNSQLFSLKTNKEYQAMLEQIAGAKADGSLMEEEILKVMDEQDVLKEELSKEKAGFAEEEKKFNQDKKNLEEKVKEVTFLVSELVLKRKRFLPSLDKQILFYYERILKGKDGLALVKVKDCACQGCFMNVTSQVINEIKMQDKIVTCESCARILYLEEGS